MRGQPGTAQGPEPGTSFQIQEKSRAFCWREQSRLSSGASDTCTSGIPPEHRPGCPSPCAHSGMALSPCGLNLPPQGAPGVWTVSSCPQSQAQTPWGPTASLQHYQPQGTGGLWAAWSPPPDQGSWSQTFWVGGGRHRWIPQDPSSRGWSLWGRVLVTEGRLEGWALFS